MGSCRSWNGTPASWLKSASEWRPTGSISAGQPRGFWLPECAYRPAQWVEAEKRERKGIDQWLADEGLAYFFVEGVGLTRAGFLENRYGENIPNTGRGYRLPSGTAVFGRNEATGRQVWSAEVGYPGDPYYLEFHAKDSESGLHYWRVTGGPGEGPL